MNNEITLKKRCNNLCQCCKENNQLIWLGDYDTIPDDFVALESLEIAINKKAWKIGRK